MAKDLFASNNATSPRPPRDLFENMPGEPESFAGKLLPNIGVGLTHAGRNLHNLPHEIVSSLENSTQGIGSAFDMLPGMPKKRQNISNYIPKDTADYQNVFRNPGENTPTDYVIQKSLEYGPDVLMGLNALRGMKLLPHLSRRGGSKKLRMAQEKFNELSKKESIGIEPINLYHGKSEKLANEILENGLQSPKYDQDYALLTNNAHTAEEYGGRTADTTGEYPQVLKISIPKNEIHDYLHPENVSWVTQANKPRGHEASQIFGIKKPIPNKYISKVSDEDFLNHIPSNVSEIMNEIPRLNIPGEVIEDLRQFLPNTTPYRNLIEKAKTGNYKDLFNLQSDVGKHASDYTKSLFSAAERAHGRAGLKARNALIDEIHTNLKSQGHHDISELLRKGQEDYKRYMKFKPYRNALLGAGTALAIPKNPLTNLLKKLLLQNTQ